MERQVLEKKTRSQTTSRRGGSGDYGKEMKRGRLKFLKQLEWCLTQGDVSPYEFAKQFYRHPHSAQKLCREFLDDMVTAGMMRKVCDPDNGKSYRGNAHIYTVNLEHDVPKIIIKIRNFQAQAMAPVNRPSRPGCP